MTLNTIQEGDNKYCGPGVLSAILGISTDEVEREVNELRHGHPYGNVTSMYLSELCKIAANHGWSTVPYQMERQSLYSLISNHPALKKAGVFFIRVSHHFVCIEVVLNPERALKREIYFVDNHTKSPINAGASARLMQIATYLVHVYKPG